MFYFSCCCIDHCCELQITAPGEMLYLVIEDSGSQVYPQFRSTFMPHYAELLGLFVLGNFSIDVNCTHFLQDLTTFQPARLTIRSTHLSYHRKFSI